MTLSSPCPRQTCCLSVGLVTCVMNPSLLQQRLFYCTGTFSPESFSLVQHSPAVQTLQESHRELLEKAKRFHSVCFLTLQRQLLYCDNLTRSKSMWWPMKALCDPSISNIIPVSIIRITSFDPPAFPLKNIQHSERQVCQMRTVVLAAMIF